MKQPSDRDIHHEKRSKLIGRLHYPLGLNSFNTSAEPEYKKWENMAGLFGASGALVDENARPFLYSRLCQEMLLVMAVTGQCRYYSTVERSNNRFEVSPDSSPELEAGTN